jgi:Secretion system C-terminal sorting domain/Bacterial Ig domain
MKIHESMNFSFYTKKILPFLLAIFGLSLEVLGQAPPSIEVIRVSVLKDDSYHHQFIQNNNTAAPQILDDAANGDGFFNPSWCCNGNQGVKGFNKINHFYYEPAANFTGRDTVAFLYHKLNSSGTPSAAWKIFYFKVVPSFLKAHDDFVATTQGQQLQITVLSNDEGNGTGQKISEVTNINNGTAGLTADSTKVIFTPNSGFTGIANLNYSICDDQGSCSFAVVNICVNPATPLVNDVLQLTTTRNKAVVAMLDIDATYSLSTPPAHGTLSGGFPLTYTPAAGYVGNDQFIYTSTNGNSRTVNIKIVYLRKESDLLVADVVHTQKNTTIDEIHLLDNDNGGAFFEIVNAIGYPYPYTKEGGTLTQLPQLGKGVYSYTPAPGFQGIDKFEYRGKAPNSSGFDTVWCYIVVDDLNPILPVYQITSPKNTPLALGDHLPLDGYSYEAISNPDKGIVDFYPGQQTYTSQHGQSFTGKNMLVYDPDPNALGYDEFEFEYCADGIPGGCQLVKVELTLVDIANPQSPTLCAGRECVWAGDTNRDGAVDVVDVLPIGLCMGDVGLSRSNGSNAWYGQTANNWNSFMADGLGYDVKYLDADGNGIVSADDTTAIGLNYGYHHNLTPSPIEAFEDLPFYIEEPNFPENLEIGDVFYAPIGLGTENIPAVNAYGLAFELLYDPAIFEVNILFQDNAWMDYNSPILSKTHKPLPGKIDAAYTRTSGLAASGFGHIGVAEFIVIDDLEGNRPNKLSTQVTLNGLGLMSGTGQVSGLKGTGFEVTLGGSKAVKAVTEDQLFIYPNPASEAITLHLNGIGHEMERVMLYSMTGNLVYDSGSMTAKRMMVDVAGFAPGMYTVRVLANGVVLNKKIEVIR